MKRACLMVLVLCAGAAFADVSPDVKKYLGSAAALFEKLEYEKALAQLKRAKAKSQGPEDDLRIALYEGIVLSEMGDANAPAAFTSALGMDPNATLPLVVGPKVQKVFDKAKAQVQKVIDAQAENDRQKNEEAKKAEDAKKAEVAKNNPPPADPVVVAQPKPQPSGGTARTLALVPAAVGVVGVAVGTVLLVQANGAHNQLRSGNPTTEADARALASSGSTMQTAGWVCVGVGIAAVAAAAGMFALGGGSGGGSASLMVTPNGVMAGLSVPLP